MKNVISANQRSLAYVLNQSVVAIYGVFRIVEYLVMEGHLAHAGFEALAIGVVMGLIALYHHFDPFGLEAFFTPLTILAGHIAVSFVTQNFIYYFSIYVCICCMGALYFNPRQFRLLIGASQVITILLMIFEALQIQPMREIPPSEILIRWFLAFFETVVIYLVASFASSKNNAAVKAQDSFNSLLLVTLNRIVLVDSLNRVLYISRPMLEMAKLKDPRMVVGRSIFDVFNDQGIKELIYDILKKDDNYEGTKEIRLDGEINYFNIITSRLPNEAGGRLINMVDITPVMKAKFEAEAASRSKSAFLATMSHEIRTPLNAIIGLSEIELQNKLASETHRNLEKIFSSGTNLLAIINDILDISKIEAGSFELILTEYDMPSMVNDTVHLNIVRIGSKNIVFKLEIDDQIPVRFLGDEVRVKQILNNLLSNAFKYTDEGNVHFQISWEQKDAIAWITFSVSDTGHGIRKEDLPRLFSEYSQLDARTNRHIEGTGLGLSITRNLVELMGGFISVESEYGRGSTFTVRIPQKIVDPRPIGETTARNLELFRFMENRRGRGRLIRSYMPYGKVLVVDDVETNVDVVRGLMIPYGLTIDCATSGPEAIGKVRSASPQYDLIFMDHMMPGMDGVEAVRIIRNEIDSDYARTVPIIALTANALAGNEEMFLSKGFNAYISKPIDIMQLDMALNTWVRNKQSEEILRQVELEKANRGADNSSAELGMLDGLYLDGIDLAIGKERYNSEGAYLDILRSYLVHTPPLLEKLQNLSRDTLPEYTVVIHGLKGSSYGICANTIGKDAQELESAARSGDFEKVFEGNGPFIETVKLLLMDLDELLKKAAASQGAKRKVPAPDTALLAKLLDAVRRYRSNVMEEILAELESCEYETGGDLVTWLREQMDNLEYDTIRKRLEEPNLIEFGKAGQS